MSQQDRLAHEAVTFIVKELSPGTHPGSGDTRVRLNMDVNLASGLGRESLPNNRDSAYRHDNAPHVRGKVLPKLPAMTWQLSGIPTAQRLDESVTPSVLSHDILLEHGMGRRYAAQGCTVGTGSTTTALVVDDTTGRIAGELVTVVLDGVRHARRITVVTDGTHVSVSPALPDAPANADIVTACRTFVLAEQRIGTLCVSHKRGGPTGEEYRIFGAFGALKVNFPSFGQILTASLEGGAIDFEGPLANGGLTSPSFGSTDPADDDMGEPLVWMPTMYVDGAETLCEPGSMKLEIASRPEEIPNGAKRSGVGGWIDTGGRENGIAASGEYTQRIDTAVHANYDAGDILHLLWVCDPGNGTGMVVEVPRAQIIERPTPVVLGQGREGITVKWKALPDSDTTLAGSPPNAQARDLGRAPIRLGLW